MLNILFKSMKRQTKGRKWRISIGTLKETIKTVFRNSNPYSEIRASSAGFAEEDRMNIGRTKTEAKLINHNRTHSAGIDTEFGELGKLTRHIYLKWTLVAGSKCWTVSLVKISKLPYIIETKLIKHQSVWTLGCPPHPECWCCLFCFSPSFTATCWDSVWPDLAQVLCVLSQLLWVHMHNHTVMSGSHCFSVITHPS